MLAPSHHLKRVSCSVTPQYPLPGKRELEDLKFTFTIDGTFSPKYLFKLVSPIESADLQFQDAIVEIILLPFSDGVGFHITNRSESVLKLVWNDAAIVDFSGKTLKVMGKGVRYITRNEPRPDASIPPGARLEDEFVPVDNVTYEGGSLGWRTKPLFPDCPECQDLQGREFKVYFSFVLGYKSVGYTLWESELSASNRLARTSCLPVIASKRRPCSGACITNTA